MNMSIEQIMQLDDDELFGLARKKTANLERHTWSPNVINPGCTTNPHCYHCKWECFKNEERMGKSRAPLDVVLKRAEMQIEMKVNRILLPSGWAGYSLPDYYFEYTNAIKKNFDIEVFGLFGAIDKNSLVSLKQAGMDGYQCGLESVNEKIYRSFRPGGDSLSDRINTLKWAREVGLKLWSGFIFGFGLGKTDIIKSLKFFDGHFRKNIYYKILIVVWHFSTIKAFLVYK